MFLIRTLSRSADGREIVRNMEIDDDLLRIGRDPNCDIRLNDLAVALHHASIELVSGGRLGVSAEMGLTVELNGSATGFGHINLHQGGDIRIGPFLLRVMPTPAGVDDVSIEVERSGDDAEAEALDVSRFALASVMPGKRPMAWISVALVLAVFLAWPIWSFYANRGGGAETAQGYHADRMWLSGSLSRGHAALKDNCQACHVTPFVPVQDESCKACHSSIHDHADLARRSAPIRSSAASAGCSKTWAPFSARVPAAASSATPSMKVPRKSRRRRSNSAPIAIRACAAGCPIRSSPTPPISRTRIPSFSRRC
jgi:hypothetical protein